MPSNPAKEAEPPGRAPDIFPPNQTVQQKPQKPYPTFQKTESSLTSLQAGIGNAVMEHATTDSESEMPQDTAEMQSMYGNAVVSKTLEKEEKKEGATAKEAEQKRQPVGSKKKEIQPPEKSKEPKGGNLGSPAGGLPGAGKVATEAGVGDENISINAEDPGGILGQLANVPPTASLTAYEQAEQASTVALEKQTQELQAGLPEIPAPTGLPPVGAKKAPAPANMGKGHASGKLKQGPSGREKEKYDTQVPAGPPPPPITTTVLRGDDASESPEEQNKLAASAQRGLNAVNLDSEGVSIKAGVRPPVDLSGEADPGQMDTLAGSSKTEVAQAKASAQNETYMDFGENNIYPKPSNKTISAKKQLSPQATSGVKGKDASNVPPELAAGLNESLGPAYKQRIGEKQSEYETGKTKFDEDVTNAHQDADDEIARLNEGTQQDQLKEQKKTKGKVDSYRNEWRTEIDTVEKDCRDKADKATVEHREKITKEKIKGETEADKHLADAEKKAAKEKLRAEKEALEEKRKSKKKSSGFWGWAKRAASALIDALKAAVNFIYDNLRKLVKGIFELAKGLVLAAIELARTLIVGLIEVYGAILKGFVTVAFAAFGKDAKKFNEKIDKAVNSAVSAVNTAAEVLSKGVEAVIDFLANTIDSLLGLVQSLYNGLFTVIGMIISGEFGELMERIGCLVKAAEEMPPHLEGSVWEQLLGVDISKPMTGGGPAAPAGVSEASMEAAQTAGEDTLSDNDIAVEPISTEAFDPELIADLGIQDGEEKVIGERSGEEYGVAGLMADFQGAKPGTAPLTPTSETATESTKTPESQPAVSRSENAAKLWEQIKTFMGKWLKDNWGKLLIGVIAALVGIIALTIVTGGSIWLALPIIMKIIAGIFVGLAIIKAAGYLKTYLSEGWAKKIATAAKALANAVAVGIVELAMALGFRAVGVALKGAAKGVAAGTRIAARGIATGAKAAASGIKRLLKSGATLVSKSGRAIIRRGKLIFVGLKGGFAKGIKKTKDLVSRLFARFRIKRISVERRGRRILIWGHFNPKVLLVNGDIEQIEVKGTRPQRGKFVDVPGRRKQGVIVSVVDEVTNLKGKKVPAPKSVYVEKLGTMTKADLKRLYKELEGLPKSKRWAVIARSTETAKHARDLRNAMKAAGKTVKKGDHAHHIVPSTHPLAKRARDILKKYDIHFNNPKNGVGVAEDVHTTLHKNNQAYITRVEALLNQADLQGKAAVEKALSRIEQLINAGKFP